MTRSVKVLAAFLTVLCLFARSHAVCTTCGSVRDAAAKCSASMSLSQLASLQTELLLNCPAALWPFGGDGCCSALTQSSQFEWEDAVNCLCGGQTGLSGLVISAKDIVESCGCTVEDARGIGVSVPGGRAVGGATAVPSDIASALAGASSGVAASSGPAQMDPMPDLSSLQGRKRKAV